MRDKQYRHIGKSAVRLDARDKVTGRAVYTFDMELPGMLYAKCLHSPYASAAIVSIDTSAAKALSGVKAVLTGEDIPYLLGLYMVDKRILARGTVRYQGEAVAAVAAVDEATAERALTLVKVEYQELTPVMTVDEALDGKTLVHEDINQLEYIKGVFFPQPDSNIASWNKTIKGNIRQGFAAADVIVESELTLPPVAHVPMETHVAIAQADPYSPVLKIWSSTQSPFGVRQLMAKSSVSPKVIFR
nr:molybdopterin cofactor-binding domain-containing protein [Acetonema longum]